MTNVSRLHPRLRVGLFFVIAALTLTSCAKELSVKQHAMLKEVVSKMGQSHGTWNFCQHYELTKHVDKMRQFNTKDISDLIEYLKDSRVSLEFVQELSVLYDSWSRFQYDYFEQDLSRIGNTREDIVLQGICEEHVGSILVIGMYSKDKQCKLSLDTSDANELIYFCGYYGAIRAIVQ
jgi:hypothetical protein